jgi:hypothetical protein
MKRPCSVPKAALFEVQGVVKLPCAIGWIS